MNVFNVEDKCVRAVGSLLRWWRGAVELDEAMVTLMALMNLERHAPPELMEELVRDTLGGNTMLAMQMSLLAATAGPNFFYSSGEEDY